MSNRLYSPKRRDTCAAGRCQPGHCVCPCPQACELPDGHGKAPTRRAVLLSAAAHAAFAGALILLVFLASSP